MEVKHNHNKNNGVFYMEDNGKQIATMNYVFADDHKIIINHTEVSPDYEGKGLGKQLVTAAVEYAREKNLKIMPLCTFAKKTFERTPEFADVLSNK